MTYAGFEQDEIQDQMDHINRIKDEYENLTPEEKSIRICTLEELMERFNDDTTADEKPSEDNDNLK